MMVGPIATSRLLMDLADVAAAEDLTPFDPWDVPPLCPDGAHVVVTLGLDGSIRRTPPEDVEWRDVAAYRFEAAYGDKLDAYDESDWEPY